VTTTPDDAVVARSAVLLDELLTDPEAFAVFAEWAAEHASPGLLDQLQAAADDTHAVMAAESRTLGGTGLIHAPHAAVPQWIWLNLLLAYATWAAGTGSTCMHSPHVSRPQPVFAAAWKPGLVVCAACVHVLALPRGSAGDRRCDGCGRVTTGPENGDGIHPGRAQYGPLLLAYGTCRNCLPTADDYRGGRRDVG
jgi:hypothetical protein